MPGLLNILGTIVSTIVIIPLTGVNYAHFYNVCSNYYLHIMFTIGIFVIFTDKYYLYPCSGGTNISFSFLLNYLPILKFVWILDSNNCKKKKITSPTILNQNFIKNCEIMKWNHECLCRLRSRLVVKDIHDKYSA